MQLSAENNTRQAAMLALYVEQLAPSRDYSVDLFCSAMASFQL
jgi:hypothetical protein